MIKSLSIGISLIGGQYIEWISIYGCCIWMHDLSVYVSAAKEMELSVNMLLYGVYSLRDSDVS